MKSLIKNMSVGLLLLAVGVAQADTVNLSIGRIRNPWDLKPIGAVRILRHVAFIDTRSTGITVFNTWKKCYASRENTYEPLSPKYTYKPFHAQAQVKAELAADGSLNVSELEAAERTATERLRAAGAKKSCSEIKGLVIMVEVELASGQKHVYDVEVPKKDSEFQVYQFRWLENQSQWLAVYTPFVGRVVYEADRYQNITRPWP